MPPSTVYKGDLTEVTFGHESGLTLKHGYAGSDFTFTASYDPNVPAPANAPHQNLTKDTSVIVFGGGASNTPVYNGILRYPNGMLVGSKVTFSIGSNSPEWSTDDDYSVTGRTYTIIKQEVANDTNSQNNNKTEITVTPALKSDHTTADKDSKTGDIMFIHAFTTPTIDVSMSHNDAANQSAERVLTDQFVGLVSTIALPETKVDLKRYHVVGLGRDVAVQVPGRYLNQGGSFECNIHNGRWFNYCLGQEVVKLHADTKETGQNTYSLFGDVSAGDDFLMFDGDSSWPTINSVQLAVGDYIILDSSADERAGSTPTVDIQTYRDTGVGGGLLADAWPNVGATQIFDKALKTEVRRIAAVQKNAAEYSVWLDDPLLYDHAVDLVVKFAKYQTDSTFGSPHRDSSTGNLTQPVEHLFFSRSTVPSFSMEVSIRRRDADSNEGTTDGGSGDSKQLTRVFRGCKVKDFSLTADTDAALRLTANFDSALCYTDTGRLETVKGDRYDTHRLFEDTANTEVERKKAGIEKGTQKPFMFYNGSISVAGTTLGQVVSFTLNGKTGVEQFYTINGANIADAETDQVPHAGTRNPKLAVEGKTEYDLEMEIIVDDPLFYHKVRRAVDHHDEDSSDSVDADMIRLSFVKQGTGADRESIDILIDDYFITEAPLPIPEDKGPIRSALKILPKTFKVISKDTILHA